MTDEPDEPTEPTPEPTASSPQAPMAAPDQPLPQGSDTPVPDARGDAAADQPSVDPGALWQPTGQPRSRALRIVVALIAVLGVILLVGYVGNAINRATNDFASAFYGGPFQTLSADDRKAIEDRFDTMLSEPLKGLSREQITARVTELAKGGLRRLDDASLVRRLKLESVAIAASSEADCAALSRASMAGQPVANDVGSRIVANLDPTQLAEWIDLQGDAIEAELADAPPPRTVAQSDVEPSIQAIFAGMDQATLDRIVAVNDNPTAATDADVCSAVRSIYEHSVTLPSPDIERFARYDIS